MKLIDGNKAREKPEKEVVFTTGINLHQPEHGMKDFDVMINGELVLWFREDGKICHDPHELEMLGFKMKK